MITTIRYSERIKKMIAPSYNEAVWNRIKQYDPQLELKWNQKINRWELWRKSKNFATTGKMMLITKLRNTDGSFRGVDNRLLSYLINNDTWKTYDADKIEREMRDYEQKQNEKVDSELYNRLVDVGKNRFVRKAFQKQYC